MKHNVAVYGSLLEGLGNHSLLKQFNAKLLGACHTKPEYTMISLGGFPGVIKNGQTSIHLEIYEVNDECLHSLDGLEGFQEGRSNNFYNRETISSPYGDTFIYFYNYTPRIREVISDGGNNFKELIEETLTNIVQSGNWKERS